MQSPTAVPRIPASASGVSTQRSAPKRSRSPAVARKTPPARPTSSPSTITSASRSSSTWKQSLIASTRSFSATRASEDAAELGQVGGELWRRVGIRVLEDEARIRGRLGLGGRDSGAHDVRGLGTDRLGGRVVEDAQPPEVRLVATDALAPLFLLDPLEVDVGLRVV